MAELHREGSAIVGATSSISLCPVVKNLTAISPPKSYEPIIEKKIENSEIGFFDNSKLSSACSSVTSGGDSTLNNFPVVDECDTRLLIENSLEGDIFLCPPISTLPLPILADISTEKSPETFPEAEYSVLDKDSFSEFSADVERAAFSAAALIGRKVISRKRQSSECIVKAGSVGRPLKMSRYSMQHKHFGSPKPELIFGDFTLENGGSTPRTSKSSEIESVF